LFDQKTPKRCLNTKTYSTYSELKAGVYIERLIENAKQSLWIISPWIGMEYAKLLASLSQKGVQIMLITSKNQLNIISVDILKASENPNLQLLIMNNEDPNQKTTFIHSKNLLS
jgi:hypothetical protein